MKKKVLSILLIVLIILIVLFVVAFMFSENILNFIYERKYDKIEKFNKQLSYSKESNLLEDNSININDFNINLSNLEYTEDNHLNFTLNFSHSEALNNVGYILKVYNEDYFLGDRFVNQTSLSDTDWLMFQEIFYKRVFENVDNPISKNNLLNTTQFVYLKETLDDGKLLHNISFTIPEEFVIKDNLNIVLFDVNYQNIGDSNFYKVNNSLSEVSFNINNK